MRGNYTAVIKQVDLWWIGWIEEVPGVNCQESTHDELMKSLQETLRVALDMNKQDALTAAGKDFREEPIAI
jgi:predicted RNase H-like HicB family nuclease